jgi:glycerol transport system ATP-binding protein
MCGEVALSGAYPALTAKVEIGIRPEFVRLSRTPDGLPVTVRR